MLRVLATQFRSDALRLALCKICAVMLTAVYVGGCRAGAKHFICVRADRTICRQSAYPLAIDNAKVGKYAAKTNSGAGYFYDDVLEYRVWFCPERGAKPVNGNDDYYVAFAEYEKAEELSKTSKGAEEPLVLVRQYEWIDEPEPGHYQAEKGNRITEWQVAWLEGSKRTPGRAKDFLDLLKERVSNGVVLTKEK
jgi:putative acetyltransferase